ncbi:MAG: hypothetical protein ACRD4A_04700, partial [Candidatus Acidiferrales bacterium]
HAPIVAFLDADDWWAKGKLRADLDAFAQNPSIAAVGHGVFEVRDDKIADEFVVPPACRIDLSNVSAARHALFGGFFLGTSRLAVRREALDRIGPIPEELVFCADTPILTLVLALGGAMLIDQPLCYYRLHADNLYAFEPGNVDKARKKYEIFSFLVAFLPKRLAELGVPPETISAVIEPHQLEVERFRLQFEKGSRWETFLVERRAYHLAYRNPTHGYALFKWLVGAVTLLLPPERFYELRNWYGRRNMGRIRGFIVDEETAERQTFAERRSMTDPSERVDSSK